MSEVAAVHAGEQAERAMRDFNEYQAKLQADRELRGYPQVIVELLSSVDRARRGVSSSDFAVDSRAYLIELMRRAAEIGLRDRDVVTMAPYRLPVGRIDLGILTPDAAIGVIAFSERDYFAQRRMTKATASAGFDYVLCIDGCGRSHVAGRVPQHAAIFALCWDEDKMIPLRQRLYESAAVDQHWNTDRTADELLMLLLDRERPPQAQRAGMDAAAVRAYLMRTALNRAHETPDPSVLMGHEIANALAEELRRQTALPRAVFTEAWLGTYGTDGIADCVLTTPASLELFEVKGDRDTPKRLPGQIKSYDRVGSSCTLVTTRRHLAKYRSRIPRHWGLMIAYRQPDGEIAFVRKRAAKRNRHQDSYGVAELLRTDSLQSALRLLGIRKNSDVYTMRKALTERLPLSAIVALAARAWAYRQVGSQESETTSSSWPSVREILEPFAAASLPALLLLDESKGE